jgi:hypothetical protein
MRDPEFFLFKYAPISSRMSFVDVGYDIVLDWWIKRQRDLELSWNKWDVPVQQIDGTLCQKLDALLPLDGRKVMVTETANGGIAYFSNGMHGDVSSDSSHMATIYRCRHIGVTMVRDGKNGAIQLIGSTQFNCTDRSVDPPRLRGVSAHKESRWEWGDYYEPFPFEELETYKAKRIKDRLTPEMVERYCRYFGIELFDTDFYAGRACIITFAPHHMLKGYVPGRVFPQKYPNQ